MSTVLRDAMRTAQVLNEMRRARDFAQAGFTSASHAALLDSPLKKVMDEAMERALRFGAVASQVERDFLRAAREAEGLRRVAVAAHEAMRASEAVREAIQIRDTFADAVRPPMFPDLVPLPPRVEPNLAARAADNLVAQIRDFQATLDPEHEVALTLTGNTLVFRVTSITPSGLSHLCFEGLDDAGNRVRLIQHVTQCSVHMVAVRKKVPDTSTALKLPKAS